MIVGKRWVGMNTPKNDKNVGEELLRQIFARCDNAHVNALRASTVLLVGAGSVGSYIAEQLVRSGLEKLVVVDNEHVEAPNVSRTIYTLADVGTSKVDALRKRLCAINPFCRVEGLPFRFQDLPEESLRRLVTEADIVIGATDDNYCQSRINHVSYWLDKASLYFGIYGKADGGEIVLIVPGITRCFSCATLSSTAFRAGASTDLTPHVDYNTGRLMAVAGLGADIQHVCSAGVKIIVALSALLHGHGEGSGFLSKMLATKMTYIVFGMTSDFWFFPAVFAQTSGQHAFQSVWMMPEGRDDCPVCGTGDRTNPFEDTKTVPVTRLREWLTQEPKDAS